MIDLKLFRWKMERELQAFTNLELKELLLQYNISGSDIIGTGKNGCILKSDRIKAILPLLQSENDKIEIKIFDFNTYKLEHNLMKQYYSGLELMLRTALFIDYKYNHLPPAENTIFEQQIKKHKNKKEYINTVLDVFEPLYIVTQWFSYYAPEKLKNPEFIPKTMEKYKNHTDVMFNRMYKARFDSKWSDTTKLWFS